MLNRKQKLRARRSPVVDAKVLDKPFDTVRADRGSADRHGRRSPDTAAVSGRRREAEQIVFLQGFGSPSRQPPACRVDTTPSSSGPTSLWPTNHRQRWLGPVRKRRRLQVGHSHGAV